MEKNDWNMLIWFAVIFGLLFFIPSDAEWFRTSILSAFDLLHDYARKHVLTCLIPALFIAGAIDVFIRKERVMKYLGSDAKKYVSYGVASVSGAILAVCSCTILPLFAGIRKRGAGLGPAITFLFAGPAINIAAMFLTLSILGTKIGIARILSAVLFSIMLGLTMAFLFREKVEKEKTVLSGPEDSQISNKVLIAFFGLMVGVLIANGLQIDVLLKYLIMGLLTLGVIGLVIWKFRGGLANSWLEETWNFTKTLIPMLFIGVFIAGFIMPLLPQTFVEKIVGSNTVWGNLAASVFGAFMYFSTLTEIPIVQALMSKGMDSGPALALLLAGPSLSLPNMLVIRKILGTFKTAVYVCLVILYSSIAGFLFGLLF